MEDVKRASEREWVRVKGGDAEKHNNNNTYVYYMFIYMLYYTTIAGNIMSPVENYCDWFVCMKTMSVYNNMILIIIIIQGS
jgi:hypothetical protein